MVKGQKLRAFVQEAASRIQNPRSNVGKFLKRTQLVSRAAAVLGNIPQLAFLKPASVAVGMLGYGMKSKKTRRARARCHRKRRGRKSQVKRS